MNKLDDKPSVRIKKKKQIDTLTGQIDDSKNEVHTRFENHDLTNDFLNKKNIYLILFFLFDSVQHNCFFFLT